MTGLERYNKFFIDTFHVTVEDLPGLKYQGIKQWDSMAHMDMMSAMEEYYGIALSTIDVLDFSSYEKGKEILAKYGVEI